MARWWALDTLCEGLVKGFFWTPPSNKRNCIIVMIASNVPDDLALLVTDFRVVMLTFAL